MKPGEVIKITFLIKNCTSHSLEIQKKATNFGDAVSVVRLIGLVNQKYPDVLEMTTHSQYKNIENTNAYASYWPFLLGSKTGFTDTAGGNLVSLFEPTPGHKIAIVVMGSTKESRFTDLYALYKNYLESIK